MYKDYSPEVKARLEEALARSLEICGGKCEGYAKALAPVDTGNLRNSITHRVSGHTAKISSNTEYAIYQEMGTYKMTAANGGMGFMRPAILEHLDEYSNIIQSEIKASID